jgi:hypothetical protein
MQELSLFVSYTITTFKKIKWNFKIKTQFMNT